jgi:AraC-like DNA-binding protein
LIALGPRGQALKDCLFKLSVDFESTSAIPSPSAVSPELVEHLLGALLTLESQRLVDDPIQTLSSQVTSLVSASQGKAWTIQKLAEQLDYSPGHLSKVFQREKKQALKDYLDEERGKAAQSLLGYSDLSVIDIALRLEFPDSMSFSHFFKRRYAQSPRDYRKEFLKKG